MRSAVRSGIGVLALLLAMLPGLARAGDPPVLDVGAVPGLDAAGRAAYARFLRSSLPRAFALSGNGRFGWHGGTATLDQARALAQASCTGHGGTECRSYAENLDVVWPGREARTPPPPGPLISAWSYEFVPDARFVWRGPAAAAGVYVWAHGYAGSNSESRGLQPPPHVRWFNNAGFDVVRFDRQAMSDQRDRAAGWLRDGLAELRRRGYRRIVAGGESRGGWNALQVLDTPGLADVVIATSPAAQGFGASLNLLAQDDDLRALVAGIAPSRTRVAVAQFTGDPFTSDADTRVSLLRRAAPRLGALLLIDRPPGFSGHYGAEFGAFSEAYGACLLHFALDPQPLETCPAPPVPVPVGAVPAGTDPPSSGG